MATMRRIPLEVQWEIETLAAKGWGPKQIYDHLLRNPKLKKLPSLRTVERVVREVTQADTSGAWTVRDGKPADVPLVLSVLAEVMTRTGGRVRWVTEEQAELIVRIYHAARDLHPWYAYLLAVLYQRGHADLDAFLAFAPWRNAERLRAYVDAFKAGYVRCFYALVEADGDLTITRYDRPQEAESSWREPEFFRGEHFYKVEGEDATR